MLGEKGNDRTFDGIRWLEFVNNASSTVPPFGILRLTGKTLKGNRQILTVDQPNFYGSFGGQNIHFVNSGSQVAAGAYGLCSNSFPFTVAYDTADGTPAIGDSLGPRAGTWKAKANTPGFKVIGLPDTTNGIVEVEKDRPHRLLAKSTATINAKSSDSNGCTVYTGAPGSEVTTGITITGAYNYSNCAINSGKFVFLDWGWWYNTANLSWFITLADTS